MQLGKAEAAAEVERRQLRTRGGEGRERRGVEVLAVLHLERVQRGARQHGGRERARAREAKQLEAARGEPRSLQPAHAVARERAQLREPRGGPRHRLVPDAVAHGDVELREPQALAREQIHRSVRDVPPLR